jgi:hypothetical protein
VTVQASGKSIGTAFGQSAGGGSVTCDGTTVDTLSIPVVASTLPFKAGTAAAGATVSIIDASFQASDYASTGAIIVRLGK